MRDGGRAEQWVSVGVVGLLAALCVVGAFLGAERARVTFNSAPLAAFWVAVAAYLAVRLLRGEIGRKAGGPLVASFGALLVLLGGMCGSDAAHRLAAAFFASQKMPSGVMVLGKGQESNVVATPDFERVEGILSFSVRLVDFRIERYAPPEGTREAAGGGIRNYDSEVVVLQSGREVLRKVIKVNKPMHYGGYHFYQEGYDVHSQQYTILLVKSDAGLSFVYAGFVLICAGAFWACYAGPLWAFFTGRGQTE